MHRCQAVGSNLRIAPWISVRRQDPSSGAADGVVVEPWDGRRPRGLRVVTVDAGACAVDIEVAVRLRGVAGLAPGVVAGLAADLGFRPVAAFAAAAGLVAAAGLAAATALVLDLGLDPAAGLVVVRGFRTVAALAPSLTAGRPVDRRVVLPAAVPCEAEVAGEAVAPIALAVEAPVAPVGLRPRGLRAGVMWSDDAP